MNQTLIGNITYFILLTQAIGFIGMIMNFTSYQQNTNRRIIFFQIIGALFFCAHFFLLAQNEPGAYVGSALNGIGFLRNAVFWFRPKKWAENIIWLYIFCISYIIAGVITWDSYISLLPVVGMLIGSYGLFEKNTTKTRRLMLGCSISWIIYNTLTGSVPGFVTEVFTISSIVIAMYKFDFRKDKI